MMKLGLKKRLILLDDFATRQTMMISAKMLANMLLPDLKPKKLIISKIKTSKGI